MPTTELKTIEDLLRQEGCDNLRQLGRLYYKETDCGVSLQYAYQREWNYWEVDSSRRKYQRGGLIHCEDIEEDFLTPTVTGLKFSTTVEGSDAEFSTDTLSFPLTKEDIDDTCAYLEEEVEKYLTDTEDS